NRIVRVSFMAGTSVGTNALAIARQFAAGMLLQGQALEQERRLRSRFDPAEQPVECGPEDEVQNEAEHQGFLALNGRSESNSLYRQIRREYSTCYQAEESS